MRFPRLDQYLAAFRRLGHIVRSHRRSCLGPYNTRQFDCPPRPVLAMPVRYFDTGILRNLACPSGAPPFASAVRFISFRICSLFTWRRTNQARVRRRSAMAAGDPEQSPTPRLHRLPRGRAGKRCRRRPSPSRRSRDVAPSRHQARRRHASEMISRQRVTP